MMYASPLPSSVAAVIFTLGLHSVAGLLNVSCNVWTTG